MEELNTLFENYETLLSEGKYWALKSALGEDNAANIAEFIEELEPTKMLFVFRLLTKDMAAEVFSFMDSVSREHVITSITDNEIRSIVEQMFIDDAVDFLGELPANLVTKVLKNTDEKKRKLINQFLNYPEDSAGSIMTIEFVQFHEDMNVKAAMEQIVKTGVNKETVYTCYVVNEKRMLIGVLPLRALIISDDHKLVSELMEDHVISVKTLDDQEMVADIFKKYSLIALPVVDNEGRLVGIITVDDIVDVIEEENTEDFEKMAALIPAEDEYMKTSVVVLARNRIVWLLILMISGTLSSAIILRYNTMLSSLTMIASFIPILMNTGGNAGSQTSTLIIRGMALGEISTKDIFKVIWKEIRIGVIAGAALSAVNFLRLALFGDTDIKVNFAVSLSLFFTVVISKAIGAMLPIIAKKMRFDPAVMAAPIITTIVDAVSLMIFFNFTNFFVFK
ncbi:MAG: magnesium transporter [Lachnospiraceae bacterium]|nr:magnesium transporter [Lachnospiraceae bacterium]